MRRAATVMSWSAAGLIVGLSLWLLVSQPAIEKGWMAVWVAEMEIGSPFDLPGAATIMGVIGLVFAAVSAGAAALMPRHIVLSGVVIIALDMLACGVIAICPDPEWGVLTWALPGVLMAAAGFLLGMELQRVQQPARTDGLD